MEKEKYNLILSLKQLALRKVAIILWSEADILPAVQSFRCQSLSDDDTINKWRENVESKVTIKVPRLLLPAPLEEELMHVIKPIGPEILKWSLHYSSLNLNSSSVLNILDQLCWTSVGTVDYRKTAELLIKQEQINLTSKYILACTNCLDGDIRIIWEKLSEFSKKFFYNEVACKFSIHSKLVIFWTYFIKGRMDLLEDLINENPDERGLTIYQYAFEYACNSGNKVAAEYFFHRLTFEERDASLLITTKRVVCKRCYDGFRFAYDFPKEKFCDVICYLLSEMNKEEQLEVFKKFPYNSLRSLIDWPWQDLIMKVVGTMWDIISVDSYYSIMLILARNRTITGCNYSKLFEELFLHAPSRFRSFVIDKHHEFGFWFRDLLFADNFELIKVIFRDVDDECRQEFILCEQGLRLCWRLIVDEKWDLLRFFVSECRLSNTNKKKLKETFMDYISRFYKPGQIKWRKRLWDTFFQIIGYTNDEDKKVEESKSNKPKRKRKRRY